MSTAQFVISIIIVIAAVFLICVVLLQSGKNSGVTSALSGGSDTFLAKNQGNTWDHRLARITRIVAAVFMIAVLVLNLV
ncbi:MAG: preprotein translocase subunit SecG [Clostridiales bacterium]|nr:preprotein translocase subunit SecG [Clostridiales bacterium]MCD8368055.1 preprotein translocase subunit SecG [Clostridiales bacterium]